MNIIAGHSEFDVHDKQIWHINVHTFISYEGIKEDYRISFKISSLTTLFVYAVNSKA